MRRKIIAMILIFIAPAVAVAGFAGIDKAIQPLRDAPIELTLGEKELTALEEYFGHIKDASCPPETSARVDIAWNEMYVHVTACMYGRPAVTHTHTSRRHLAKPPHYSEFSVHISPPPSTYPPFSGF